MFEEASSAAPLDSSSRTLASVKRRRAWKRLRGRLAVLACQFGLLAVLLGLWQYATSKQALNAFLFGSPSEIWGFLVKMQEDGSLVHDAGVTGMETLLGFLLGNVIGTVLGLLLWYSRFVSKVVHPFVVALGSIPVVALAPLVIIWFGTGLASKLAMSTLSVVVVALVIAYKGATGVDDDQINLMRTLGAAKRQVFTKLVIPASLRDIFAGLKLTVGFALIGAILGEFMSSADGLGHAIFKAGSLYIIPKVFAGVVVTIVLALFLSFLVGRLERFLMPWHKFD
ncbi:ABC transporter permease [Caballeronia mineralivorans PML1(12)]|uniref:ABC transporter permease n=1 Tax=Caballeronia mineralivorans PML1(12) TaxID=908627 RepID=A0A0J1CKJ1_9BURK|nr:ABC transporter permease [Caballeronia mineralivorans]KLU21250.1 ABC transporter permease [Caballeronia mineralivorans PML1(12)]